MKFYIVKFAGKEIARKQKLFDAMTLAATRKRTNPGKYEIYACKGNDENFEFTGKWTCE